MIVDAPFFADGLRAIHVIAAVIGLAAALYADACGLKILLLPGRSPTRGLIERLHGLIMLALCAMIGTGVAIVSLWLEMLCVPGDGPMIQRIDLTLLPSKTVDKLTLTLVLTFCAVLIDRHMMPLARMTQRPLLPHLEAGAVVRVAWIGSASLVCWLSIAAVAVVRPLQDWPVPVFLGAVLLAWIAVAALAVTGLLSVRLVMRWVGLGSPHVTALGNERFRPNAISARHVSNGTGLIPRRADSRDDALTDALAGLARRLAPARASQRANERSSAGADATADPPQGDGCATIDSAFAACRGAIGGAAGISLVTNLLMLTGPLYMLQVYDRVLTSRSVDTLMVLTFLVVGLYVVLGVLELIRSRILSRVGIRLDRLLGPALMSRAISVAPVRPGQHPSQPVRDLEQVCQFVAGPATTSLLDLPWVPVYFAVVFLMHPLLGLLTIAGAVVLVALSVASEVMARRPLAEAAEDAARGHAMVEAGRRSSEALTAMGIAERYRSRWLEQHRRALSRQLQAGDVAGNLVVASRVCRLLLQSLLLGLGAYLALHDQISGGAMIATSIIASRALAPIEQIVGHWRSLIGVRGAIARCRDLLDEDKPRETRLALPEPHGDLAVSNLYVAALGRNEPIIKGLNFRLEPGDALAVVGPSAAGKSTLARALVGVWPARHGEVRLDGAALDQWEPSMLGRHIGYLPQNVDLLDGTIAENIARFEAEPDPRAVLAAATAAGVHDMILRLEQGYATRIGEGGAALSGGQRQRIGLARALYGSPALIVLDEPNANLDADGEAALTAAIAGARAARRTLVVMAHRRSVLKAVNKVLIMKDGRQAAFGPLAEILGARGEHQAAETADGSRSSPRLAARTTRAASADSKRLPARTA